LGFDLIDANVFLAVLEYLLARAMAPDFCRGREYPQIFAREVEVTAVIKIHCQYAGLFVQKNVCWTRVFTHATQPVVSIQVTLPDSTVNVKRGLRFLWKPDRSLR